MKSPQNFNKRTNNYIWESAIPDYEKQKVLKESFCNSRSPEAQKRVLPRHPFFSRRKSNELLIQQSPDPKTSSGYYSIKYLGVTKGQIGILSKRAPIPQLSPLETCKDVPLVLINSSMIEPKPSRLLSTLASSSSKRIEKRIILTREGYPLPNMYSNPSPEENNEYVIHTYSRPRGLSAISKGERKEAGIGNKAVAIPVQRCGVSGWKLTRAKTASPQKGRVQRNSEKKLSSELRVECKHINVHEGYSEPYLKHISKSHTGLSNERIKNE